MHRGNTILALFYASAKLLVKRDGEEKIAAVGACVLATIYNGLIAGSVKSSR